MDPERKLIASDAETGEYREGTVLRLSDSTLPAGYRPGFVSAVEAIQDGSLDNLKKAVRLMQTHIPEVPPEDYLDVCDMVLGVDETKEEDRHPMTLLAFAGYYGHKEMMDYLIEKGAHVDMGDDESGTPLIQMMAYFVIQQSRNKPDQLDISIVRYFIEKKAVLSRILTAGMCENTTAFELSFSLRRLDVAQLLVRAGVDPIFGGDPYTKPVFSEYVEFRSVSFIKWLLFEHLKSKENIHKFVDRLFEPKDVFQMTNQHVIKRKGKNVAHAFLLSGHKEAIRYMLSKKPDMMYETDPFNKTALHLAAESGDHESVHILLELNAPIDAESTTSMTPLMLAAMNRHGQVVKEILKKFGDAEDADDKRMALWPWGLQHGFGAYFEAMHEETMEHLLLLSLDNDDNTIAHLAALEGITSVFKATFPRIRPVPSFEILKNKNKGGKTPLHLAIEKGNLGMLNALQERREERKKRVHDENLDEQQIEYHELQAWQKFWEAESPGLLLYSCLHGTVDIVKYFITKYVSPVTSHSRYTPLCCAAKSGKHDIVSYLLSIREVTPEGVEKEQSNKIRRGEVPEEDQPYSPLMLASMYGHAKCVTLLLDKFKEADVNIPRSQRNYNCLMEAIDAGHEEVAAAIVQHPHWKEMMRMSQTEETKKDTKIVTPMRMLIESMPEVAEKALTKSITDKEGTQSGHSGYTQQLVNNRSVFYEYEFIEDYGDHDHDESGGGGGGGGHSGGGGSGRGNTPPSSSIQFQMQTASPIHAQRSNQVSSDDLAWLIDANDEKSFGTSSHQGTGEWSWRPKKYIPLYLPLTLMVNHERLKLLQHPLISRYIQYKWLKTAFLFIIFYLTLYVVFILFLTSFAVSLPRPGPDDEFCPSNTSGAAYDDEDADCKGPSIVKKRSFTALAVLLILLSIAFLVLEICLLFMIGAQQKYYVNYETVIRVASFLMTIIFVFGFWNDCWCAPAWQWQIGAFAVFLAYINLVLYLRGLPIVGLYINLLVSIVIKFLELIYLPVLLILAFAFPFYMVFVRDGAAVFGGEGGILETFSTPALSIARVIVQTTGELDYGDLFLEGGLLYTPMAYILFIVFIVLMPILFNNLLLGLAVNITDEELSKATFNNIKVQVDYVVALENSKPLRKWGMVSHLEFSQRSNANKVVSWFKTWLEIDYASQINVLEQLNSSREAEDAKVTDVVKKEVSKMAVMIDSVKEEFAALERNQKQLQESLEAKMQHLETTIKQLLNK